MYLDSFWTSPPFALSHGHVTAILQEVTELKVDSKHSQVFVVSEKGMCVINYRVSSSVFALSWNE